MTVWTLPLASVTPEEGVNVTPPTVVDNEKSTVAPGLGPPPLSSTWNTTVDVDEPPMLPSPLSVMVGGVADMNLMEPIAAGETVTVPLAERFWLFGVVLAVTKSLPLQPVATYVAVAVPLVVVTVGVPVGCPKPVMLAKFWPTQAELNVTTVDAV